MWKTISSKAAAGAVAIGLLAGIGVAAAPAAQAADIRTITWTNGSKSYTENKCRDWVNNSPTVKIVYGCTTFKYSPSLWGTQVWYQLTRNSGK